MTYSISQVKTWAVASAAAVIVPLAASAETSVPYTLISDNTPEKVAVIEALVIDRSGLAVAPVDIWSTGGLSAEVAQVTLASSARPASRGTAVLASSTNTDAEQLGVVTKSTRTAPGQRGIALFDLNSAQRDNRQLPVTPRANARRTLPAAGPTYLLGVFR